MERAVRPVLIEVAAHLMTRTSPGRPRLRRDADTSNLGTASRRRTDIAAQVGEDDHVIARCRNPTRLRVGSPWMRVRADRLRRARRHLARRPRPGYRHRRMDRRQPHPAAAAAAPRARRRPALGYHGTLGQTRGPALGRVPLRQHTRRRSKVGGIRVPTSMRVGYFFGPDRWQDGEFLRARIPTVTFI